MTISKLNHPFIPQISLPTNSGLTGPQPALNSSSPSSTAQGNTHVLPARGADNFFKNTPLGRAISEATKSLNRYESMPGLIAGKNFLTSFNSLKDLATSDANQAGQSNLAYFKKPYEQLQDSAKKVAHTLEAVLGLDFIHQGPDELDNQAFTGKVNDVVDRALKFNRGDVFTALQSHLNLKAMPFDISPGMPESALNDILKNETIKNSEIQNGCIGNLLPHHVKPPSDALRIHKESLAMFLNADVGQAFSGLIHIRENATPKIFLAPLMPSQGNRDDPSKIYAIKNPGADKLFTIYSKRKLFFKPIVHFRLLDGVPQPAHKQFVELISKKYEKDDVASKKYVGFSVVKGRVAKGINNRYEFVSRTVNVPTFQDAEGKDGDRVAPAEWQKSVRRTFDRLAIAEYAMDRDQSPAGSADSSSSMPSQTINSENKLNSSNIRAIQDLIKNKTTS
jgi:hypothetical protein